MQQSANIEIVPFDELSAMSEYKRPADIKRWLSDNGIPFVTSRTGKPRVNRYALRRIMGGGGAADELTDESAQPDFEAIG